MTRTLNATTADGLTLHADDWGPTGDPAPIICLPGLTRNARDFRALAKALSRDDRTGKAQRVIALDSRGRGRSTYAAQETYTLPQELNDLVAAMDAWGIERARFVGTSRGGLLTMLLAITAPQRIDRAVLNDIGPRIEPTGLARIAGEVGATMSYPSFDALAFALHCRFGDHFLRLSTEHWLRFAQQLASQMPDGTVRFDYDENLKHIFEAAPNTGSMPDLWPAFDALAAGPVLVIRGAHSDILSAATVEAMRRSDRTLSAYLAPGEGHAPLLWDRRSIETVKRFLLAPPMV